MNSRRRFFKQVLGGVTAAAVAPKLLAAAEPKPTPYAPVEQISIYLDSRYLAETTAFFETTAFGDSFLTFIPAGLQRKGNIEIKGRFE